MKLKPYTSEDEFCQHLLMERERQVLVEKRTSKPFREPETPHENLPLGICMCVLIMAVVLFVLAGAR